MEYEIKTVLNFDLSIVQMVYNYKDCCIKAMKWCNLNGKKTKPQIFMDSAFAFCPTF